MTGINLAEFLRPKQALLWVNPELEEANVALAKLGLSLRDVEAASRLFGRWAPILKDLFPELEQAGGSIKSPLIALEYSRGVLGFTPPGATFLKADHELPVAGSIKARGGIFEVISFADSVAKARGIPILDGDQGLNPDLRTAFQNYTISVGSTGNLGISIGIVAQALGFRAVVHMSAIAKAWKKKLLRARGVEVIEHLGDFSEAVAAGRRSSAGPKAYFVDDEHSERLFLGYSAAAFELRDQLHARSIRVSGSAPLIVYIPCGVGGAPGGITFGLKLLFGDAVHCFFVEPCASPCFMVGLASSNLGTSVYDVGLDGVTEADGLAVARASALSLEMMRGLVSGVMTVTDDDLFRYVYRLSQTQKVGIEPSAAAGFIGPELLTRSAAGRAYCDQHKLSPILEHSTHVLWTTGGRLVPSLEMNDFIDRGRRLQDRLPLNGVAQ